MSNEFCRSHPPVIISWHIIPSLWRTSALYRALRTSSLHPGLVGLTRFGTRGGTLSIAVTCAPPPLGRAFVPIASPPCSLLRMREKSVRTTRSFMTGSPFVLASAKVSQRRMAATRIVPPLQPSEDLAACILACRKVISIQHLSLQAGKVRFHHRIVEAIPNGAHGTHDLELEIAIREGDRRVFRDPSGRLPPPGDAARGPCPTLAAPERWPSALPSPNRLRAGRPHLRSPPGTAIPHRGGTYVTSRSHNAFGRFP